MLPTVQGNLIPSNDQPWPASRLLITVRLSVEEATAHITVTLLVMGQASGGGGHDAGVSWLLILGTMLDKVAPPDSVQTQASVIRAAWNHGASIKRQI